MSVERLQAWYDNPDAVGYSVRTHRPYANPTELKADVRAVCEALERIVSDIETNSEAGAPQYLWDALGTNGNV